MFSHVFRTLRWHQRITKRSVPGISQTKCYLINFPKNNHGRNYYTRDDSFKLLFPAGFLPFFSREDDNENDMTPPKQYIIRLKKSYPFLEINEEEKKQETPQEQFIRTLKYAIAYMQLEQFAKAEQMLHLSLRMAQDQHDFDGITYCFDIMANLALEVEQFKKAEKLFVNVMQRLLQKGHTEDDIQMLHISAKIARIHSELNAHEKAELGFKWTLDKIKNKLSASPEDKDLYELLGLVKNWYGKHLMNVHRYSEALSNLSSATEIYIETHSKDDVEVIDLLNNLACCYLQNGGLDMAEKYIDEALKLAEFYPTLMNTGIYQANKGLISLKKGLLQEARRQCLEALRKASKSEIREGQEQAKYCLEQIELFNSK